MEVDERAQTPPASFDVPDLSLGTTAPPSTSPEDPAPGARPSAAQLAAAFQARAREAALAKALAARDAAAVPRDGTVRQSSPLSSVDGDADDGKDDDSLPDMAELAPRTRAAGLTATEDDGSLSTTRKSARVLEKEAQREEQKAAARRPKVAERDYGGAPGKYSLAALVKDRAKEDKRRMREEANAAKVAGILQGPAPEMVLSPQRRVQRPQLGDLSYVSPDKGAAHDRNPYADLDESMARFAGEDAVGEEGDRNQAIRIVREADRSTAAMRERREKQIAQRRFWRAGIEGFDKVASYAPPAMSPNSNPQLRRVHKTCAACVQSPRTFAVSLAGACRSSPTPREDAAVAAIWFFDIATHPALPVELGDNARLALVDALQIAAGNRSERQARPASLPISLAVIQSAFLRLGARTEAQRSGAEAVTTAAPIGHETVDVLLQFGGNERRVAARRIVRTCEDLGRIGSWRDATGDLIGIALLLTRLSLDSHASSLLGPIQAAISALVNAIQSQPQAPKALFDALLLAHGGAHQQIQHHVLLNLPHRHTQQRLFRRWLAFAFLTKADPERLRVSGFDLSSPPPYKPLGDLLDRTTSDRHSPFRLRKQDKQDDAALCYGAHLLQIALTDLYIELASDVVDPVVMARRRDLRLIVKRLDALQRSIPTDIRSDSPLRTRAKNLLIEIGQGLDYQLPAKHEEEAYTQEQNMLKTWLQGVPAKQPPPDEDGELP